MCGWVLQHERSLLFGEASLCWLDEATAWEKGQQSAILVPLFGKKQIIGGLSALGKKDGGSFTQHDLDLLTMFANQVSTAIENAILFRLVQTEVEERRRAEVALRESEQSYKTLAENLPGLVYRVFIRKKNRMRLPQQIKPGDDRMSGQRSGTRRNLFDYFADPARRPPCRCCRGTTGDANKQAFAVEYRLRHRDGTIRYLSEVGAPIAGRRKAAVYRRVIFDNTERRRGTRSCWRGSDVRLRAR
jgi:PAS domain-containing protein